MSKSATLLFEDIQGSGMRPTKKVIEEAALEIIDAIKTAAEHIAPQEYSQTEDVDIYIDEETNRQADLVVLLDKLTRIEKEMPASPKKDKIKVILDKYKTAGVGKANDFINLCQDAIKSF